MLCESGLTRPDSTCLSGGSDHSDVMLQSNLSARATQTNLAFWTCAAVTCISALVSAGFSVVGLSGPSAVDDLAHRPGVLPARCAGLRQVRRDHAPFSVGQIGLVSPDGAAMPLSSGWRPHGESKIGSRNP